MSTRDQVTALMVSANFAAKRIIMTERLRELDDAIAHEMAFNSLAPCGGNTQEVFRHLDAARAHVRDLPEWLAKDRGLI